ncbi:hypothetical protein [Microbulbifer sp.]|uniref:hypothetical protein n=1 Tax=Microbulbifer sp. TaxID=1908541 RepID=UPI003F2F0A1A
MEGIRTPAQGGTEKADTGNSTTPKRVRFTPRQLRAVSALLERPRSREELDRITGASNGPEVVAQLRRRGFDIPCRLVPHIDRDGLAGQHGIYHLSENDRGRLGGAL